MSRPLRDRNPFYNHLVTVRTEEARLWMAPNEKVKDIVGGVVARYQEIFKVVIYAIAILGNHLHILLYAPGQDLDEFMENVLREIARRINRQNKRRGHFWSRRYDDQVILLEDDMLEAYLYVLTNSVRHGLVQHASLWPGFNCYTQVMDGQSRSYPFVHYSKRDKKGIPEVTYHQLTLTPLPEHKHLSVQDRATTVKQLIGEREQQIQAERKAAGKGFLGLKGLSKLVVGQIPETVSSSDRPPCYTTDSEERDGYIAERKEFREQYQGASELFRAGNLTTKFPEPCFKPPLHRMPRSALVA